MAAPAKNKSLRVLCFGDSLTWGYSNGGQLAHPYSIKLKERLAQALPHTKLEVITNGLSGDVASFSRFATRLQTECDKRWFDWVIVLAGTNDLGYGIESERIFAALEKAWDIPLSRNSKVLALTVPECYSRNASVERRRAILNEMILSHEDRNYHSFNLRVKIPYHSLSKEDQEKYWDDGLHMTPAGYDWMGNHVADALLECLAEEDEEEEQQSRIAAPKPPRPPTKTREEQMYEEEDGNPKHISQGYIVVRKEDLD